MKPNGKLVLTWYRFISCSPRRLGMISMGIVAVTRLGIVTTKQLSKNRCYAYFILTVVAMLLPGTDPITMLVELAPLLALFELSLILSRMIGTPSDRAAPAEPEPPASPAG